MNWIVAVAVLSGRGPLLFRKMGMNDGNMAFALLKSATVFSPVVDMKKRHHEESEEDGACGQNEDRAAHGGYYKQSNSQNQLERAIETTGAKELCASRKKENPGEVDVNKTKMAAQNI